MAIESKKTIYFELLGLFSYAEGENSEQKKTAIPGKAGKKALSFLQYLVVNHGRSITSEELIEQFWTENNSSDPANALKNMLFKTRALLKAMFPGTENLIQTLQGCYAWNASVQVKLDTEAFEQVCLEARKRSGKEYLDTLAQAVRLYKGDFLLGNDSGWAVSLRRYYQTLYLDACKMILPLLQEKERWTEMISICEQAQAVDLGADTFVVYQMEAMIALGQPERALEVYENFRETLWKEFEIEPGDQVERVQALAESMCQNNMDAQDILKLVVESEYDGKAFFCTFGVFQSIVALEKRHLARTGHSSSLAVVSLGNKVTPTTDARRLERTLLESLRTGDPVARLDAGSYILMLTGASQEDALQVMDRIDRTFHKTYSHSKACISYRISPLKADIPHVS